MRRKLEISLVVGVFLASCLVYVLRYRNKEETPKPEYTIAAHYFADEWPINFWNSEWDNLSNDLAQIKQDGFNTVIVVVPWREFQPSTEPVKYNQYVFERLDDFFGEAQKNELMVQIRLGYLHDFYGAENAADRFYNILSSEEVKTAWLDYARKVYRVCNKHNNFTGGFITWEDFWHNYMLMDYVGDTEAGLTFSINDRFPEYLASKYTIDEFNKLYGTEYEEFTAVSVPSRESLYAAEWFQFIDEFTCQLLKETSEVFPNLFMEVRTDEDRMRAADGEYTNVSHKRTWQCGNALMTAIMYKPNQGLQGENEKLAADEAINNLDRWLNDIYQHNGNKYIYIDQFLFVDNTPGFTGGDIIREEEQYSYLTGCADVLQKYTKGYGVWTYRNYCNNLLFNSQFALKLEGWEKEGDVTCLQRNETSVVKLSTGARIFQSVPAWRKSIQNDERYHMTLNYETPEECVLNVRVGTQEQSTKISGRGRLELYFIDEEDMSIEIRSDGEIYLDNLKLYNFVQSSDIYSLSNEPLSSLGGIQGLNDRLNKLFNTASDTGNNH